MTKSRMNSHAVGLQSLSYFIQDQKRIIHVLSYNYAKRKVIVSFVSLNILTLLYILLYFVRIPIVIDT